ncbi:MAG: YggT family protein [Clostridia bacterium]|nr:YggT family protein [Clostridia bacterium]
MLENIIIRAVLILSEVVEYLILIRIILQIFRMPYNIFVNFIYSVTEPILGPARELLNKIFKRQLMMDFSPILVWCLLDYVIVPVVVRLIQYIF